MGWATTQHGDQRAWGPESMGTREHAVGHHTHGDQRAWGPESMGRATTHMGTREHGDQRAWGGPPHTWGPESMGTREHEDRRRPKPYNVSPNLPLSSGVGRSLKVGGQSLMVSWGGCGRGVPLPPSQLGECCKLPHSEQKVGFAWFLIKLKQYARYNVVSLA